MIDLKNIVFSIILTSIVISICEFLSPNDLYKKRMKILTGTVFLISLLSPIKAGVNIDYNRYSESNIISVDYEYVVARSVFEEINVLLDDFDVDDASVDIQTKTDENGSVNIESISIDLKEDKLTNKQLLIKKIEDITNIKVQINED